MNTIHVESVLHRGERRIKLIFQYDPELVKIVKGINGIKWSATMHCWHLPYSDDSIDTLGRLIQDKTINVPEYNALCYERRFRFFGRELTESQERSIKEFKEYMEVQRYSQKTIETYIQALRTFFSYARAKDISQFNNSDIKEFNYNYVIRNGFSASYQNQIISAIKLFYKTQLGIDTELNELQRPLRSRPLPEVFSIQEVEKLLKSVKNLKHRTMLALIYACGLRRSELINLKITSIDSGRKMLKIRESKGNKDRLVPLPESLIMHLREYYKEYRPSVWLFEGYIKGRQYSVTSLREVFDRAKARAGISKKLTLHSLRHSYATHLLENGVDLRFIQELLGHKSSKTTEIYTHVTTKSLEKIKSPYEQLNL